MRATSPRRTHSIQRTCLCRCGTTCKHDFLGLFGRKAVPTCLGIEISRRQREIGLLPPIKGQDVAPARNPRPQPSPALELETPAASQAKGASAFWFQLDSLAHTPRMSGGSPCDFSSLTRPLLEALSWPLACISLDVSCERQRSH